MSRYTEILRAPSLPLSLRLALRELRGGIGGFRIFVACLAIGVAAIAAAGLLNRSVQEGLQADAQALLGGDLEVRLLYRDANPAEKALLDEISTASHYMELRSMARAVTEEARRTLVEVKAVDGLYPLYGAVELAGGGTLAEALAPRDGVHGAVIAPNLPERLDIAIGDKLRIGDIDVEIRDILTREPDEIAGVFNFGPRVMVAAETVYDAGLVLPGSLVEYHYLLRADQGVDATGIRARLNEAFPDAGWRIRGTADAAASLSQFLNQLSVFLVLVGLTSLLVGGVGVANAVKAYLDGRIRSIAVLKCLGAPAGLVARVYGLQLGLLASLGIVIGLLIGLAIPAMITGVLEGVLPVRARFLPYPEPLLLAALFGYLTALVFALWPLGQARQVRATALFRAATRPLEGMPHRSYLIGTVIGGLALAGVAIFTAENTMLAAWFVGGAVFALLLFRLAATGVARLAAALPHPAGYPSLRLAMTNLHRPGSATASVILSLGLGLSVLVAVALIQGNLSRQITETMPDNAPSFFFIDIQPDQVDQFTDLVDSVEGVQALETADMIRGRIAALKGVPSDEAVVHPDARWALRGDRGFTTAATLPPNSELVSGEWWDPDTPSPTPLFSVTHDLAQGLGLAIGDEITVNILGRDITGTLANTRRVEWQSLSMNFTFALSPGSMAGAPRTFIATVRVPEEAEASLERAVTDALPNVSVIGVRQAL
ncbi:MAG: ABC transporter permease, partial [Rhodospirillaceae bacterium]